MMILLVQVPAADPVSENTAFDISKVFMLEPLGKSRMNLAQLSTPG